jgi:REP element-mobilizing transposase RayT
MNFYRRNLPHWQPPEAQYFITFRLAGSLPKEATQKIKYQCKEIEKKLGNDHQNLSTKINRAVFQKYERLLENSNSGPFWLRKPKVAKLVCNAIEYRDSKKYDLYAYCIMPNHVHLVFKLLKTEDEIGNPVTKILSSLKRFTAREANKVLGRKGQFWQHESFDRVIRNQEELESTIRYVLQNPVKAKLITKWTNWPYSFCKLEFKNDFT